MLIFTQYTNSCTNNFVFFSMAMSLTCSWSSGCCCSTLEMIICLPFMITPSITNMSSLMDQYCLMSWCNCSLACGQPLIIKDCTLCKCSSCLVTCWIYCMDMYSSTSVKTCTTSTLMSKPLNALPFFSWWVCWDNQSAITVSGSGLYIILILYWWILMMMWWILWDSIATSFLNMATKGLWSVIMVISLAKQWWWNISRPCSMPSASLSMLLYLCSVLVRLLLSNAIGHRTVF